MDQDALPDTQTVARALRSHLGGHNLRVVALAFATLLAAVVLWVTLYAVSRWLVLLSLTAVKGLDAALPAHFNEVFSIACLALFAVACIDHALRTDERPKDHKSLIEIALEFAFAIPRITLAFWGTLRAWQHLDPRELTEAAQLVERLAEMRRLRFQSLPLEIPDDARRFKILFALQLVQVIDIRREDRELWVMLNPLRPPALRKPLARQKTAEQT